ncbi:MAG: AAA family ATPase [bacterium]
MKILKLDLMAFGPFTDVLLDLSSGQHGISVIYGPNEAGKSSSLRAITDFFYGIPARTPDDFIHPYGRLRIGAQLQHSDGTILDLVRRKANQNSLRLGDDVTPLDDGELSRFLGDVDRDLFLTMFGIDHERLRRGGSEIVQGSGQIGELLFAAGAGLADLKNVQTQLQSEINALLTKTGRSGAIASDVTEFKNNQKDVKDLQVSVDTWKSHDEALRTAQTQKNKLDEAIRKKRSEQNRLARIRDAVSAIGRWRKANEDLAEVRDAPLLPEDFSDTSHAALIELRTTEQQREDAENAIAKIDGELESVSIPEELLRESDAIESMRDRLGGHLKAMRDRPKLETSRELSESEAKEFLRKLGRAPDLSAVEELRLPADKTIRIQNLGNQQEGLIERLQSDRRDCERIRRKIAKAESRLHKFPGSVGSFPSRRILTHALCSLF